MGLLVINHDSFSAAIWEFNVRYNKTSNMIDTADVKL